MRRKTLVFGKPGGFMNRRVVFYLFVIVALTVGFLVAQEITGDIRGVVNDASGALISGAKIDVINTDRNTTIRTLTTGSDGSFVAPYLPVGHYQIVIEAPGFKKFLGNDIILNHYCPAINRIESTGWNNRADRTGSCRPEVPVK